MIRPFLFLVDAFIATFGITQPTRAGAERAARVLAWVSLGVAAALALLIFVFREPLLRP